MKISRIHFVHLRLSSPHVFQPDELRNLCPEMLLCLEGKGFVQPLVPSPLHQPDVVTAVRAWGAAHRVGGMDRDVDKPGEGANRS
jgi:hypothetical protein